METSFSEEVKTLKTTLLWDHKRKYVGHIKVVAGISQYSKMQTIEAPASQMLFAFLYPYKFNIFGLSFAQKSNLKTKLKVLGNWVWDFSISSDILYTKANQSWNDLSIDKQFENIQDSNLNSQLIKKILNKYNEIISSYSPVNDESKNYVYLNENLTQTEWGWLQTRCLLNLQQGSYNFYKGHWRLFVFAV